MGGFWSVAVIPRTWRARESGIQRSIASRFLHRAIFLKGKRGHPKLSGTKIGHTASPSPSNSHIQTKRPPSRFCLREPKHRRMAITWVSEQFSRSSTVWEEARVKKVRRRKVLGRRGLVPSPHLRILESVRLGGFNCGFLRAVFLVAVGM